MYMCIYTSYHSYMHAAYYHIYRSRSAQNRDVFSMARASASAARAARPRAGHDKVQLLVDIFEPYFTSPVRIRPYGPGLNNRMLYEHRCLLGSLRNIQDNMSFVPLVMKTALREIAEKKATTWKFTKQDFEFS